MAQTPIENALIVVVVFFVLMIVAGALVMYFNKGNKQKENKT